MTVRDELIDMGWYYYSPGEPCEEWADAIIAKIAHELAEQIREMSGPTTLYPGEKEVHPIVIGMNAAADLIDPKFDDGISDHLYHESCPGTCCGGNEDA